MITIDKANQDYFRQVQYTPGMCQRGGGQGEARAPPDFGRSEGAALLCAPPDF